jgi:electron transfer flavoprotein alpha subunit
MSQSAPAAKSIWVFGDYRNYFQNRVTLQLLARAADLAPRIGAQVCAVVFGHDVNEYAGEYIAHGAQRVFVVDHPDLKNYSADLYTELLVRLAREHGPEIILVGATSFGRELAPRAAMRLGAGLTADCVGLDINEDGLLVQTAPAFGGNLLAEIVTPEARPQMATVRPGIFKEIPHDYNRTGLVERVPYPEDMPEDRVRLISSERREEREQRLEDAAVVVCGGRGMGSKKKFRALHDLAALLGGEVGATRPVVYSQWAGHDALVGQAGRTVRPRVLFSFGVSGAIQHTAAISGAELIVAVNKNPNAAMMRLADVAIVADASQVCAALIRELKARIRN